MLAQGSLAELGTPLAAVTFCVVDLETTGGSPHEAAITEVGAVKVRFGEVIGTFQSLIDPGEPVPAFIRLLTGISDEMLRDAPSIDEILPSFLEFSASTVLVAHNARFDVSFLNAALARAERTRLGNKVLDTALLARKILADEVPNHKLSTLARHLRCAHQPSHRAYDDALATTDVLHSLIERVAGFGVTTLEDLAGMSSTKMDGTFSKISLADGLPNGIGVYRFLGADGSTLYVGKATDVRSRARSYFYGDPRRKIRNLLRETQAISAESHLTLFEAEVHEARAIAREHPLYNRAGKRPASWYLKFVVRGRAPRLAAARAPKEDGNLYVGPFESLNLVGALIDALRDAFRIHRCTDPARCRGCAFGDIGSCVGTAPALHRREMLQAITAALCVPQTALEHLRARMMRRAGELRFEEAEELRRRAAWLERALLRCLEVRALVDAGDLVLGIGDRAVLIRAAQLAAATHLEPGRAAEAMARLRATAEVDVVGSFLTAEVFREARVIAAWLRRHAGEIRILASEGSWALPPGAGPAGCFEPKKGLSARRAGRSLAKN